MSDNDRVCLWQLIGKKNDTCNLIGCENSTLDSRLCSYWMGIRTRHHLSANEDIRFTLKRRCSREYYHGGADDLITRNKRKLSPPNTSAFPNEQEQEPNPWQKYPPEREKSSLF